MKDIAGKVAFITGAASGMGLGMARAFSAAGMKVMLADIEKTALDQAVAELRAQGREVAGVVTDVTRRDSVFAAPRPPARRTGAGPSTSTCGAWSGVCRRSCR